MQTSPQPQPRHSGLCLRDMQNSVSSSSGPEPPLCSQDPFGEQLKEMMEQIQQYMEMPGLPQNFGTQIYEQHIVELEKRGEEAAGRVQQGRAGSHGDMP